jgi:hypothetical protein
MCALLSGVTRPMASAGGCASNTLIEVRTVSGNTYFWSEQRGNWNSIIDGTDANLYLDWLVGVPTFSLYGSTQTSTGSFSVQNLSGNTVQRDVALAYARNEFIGAFVYIRIWRADAETAVFTFIGNIVDADIDEKTMDLSIEGFDNYSAIKAPGFSIDVACGLIFGGIACGSTATVPCQQSYGTCSSIERFQGIVVQWDYADGIAPLVSIAQPAPAVSFNPGRAF